MRHFVQQVQRGLIEDFDLSSGRGFVALLEAFRATGGTAPGEIVGRLLEEHQAGNAVSLAKLIDTGRAFGFEWRDSLWIPMFQFDANDLALKAGAHSVRAELPAMWSGWHVASWFAAPNAQLAGQSPADRFDADLEAVVHAARSHAGQSHAAQSHATQSPELVDDFSVPPARRDHEVAAQV